MYSQPTSVLDRNPSIPQVDLFRTPGLLFWCSTTAGDADQLDTASLS